MDANELEQKRKNMKRAMEIRAELFDLANSFAGERTGIIAVQLHGACNEILRAKRDADDILR